MVCTFQEESDIMKYMKTVTNGLLFRFVDPIYGQVDVDVYNNGDVHILADFTGQQQSAYRGFQIPERRS